MTVHVASFLESIGGSIDKDHYLRPLPGRPGYAAYCHKPDYSKKKRKEMAEIMATASGYALDVPSPIATGGGFKDWFIEKTGRPGFTIEIGRGKNPLPIDELNPIFARLYETMVLALVI